jgi:hypothetical protein
MAQLTITRAVPNPSGKDRTPSHLVTNQQLVEEWIEFANTSGFRLDLVGFALDHYTFDRACTKTGEDRLTTFTGYLEAGQSMRVRTGSGNAFIEGLVAQVFLNRNNFIWNNQCGDTVVLRGSLGVVDWASYAGQPGEGAVLQRVAGSNVFR